MTILNVTIRHRIGPYIANIGFDSSVSRFITALITSIFVAQNAIIFTKDSLNYIPCCNNRAGERHNEFVLRSNGLILNQLAHGTHCSTIPFLRFIRYGYSNRGSPTQALLTNNTNQFLRDVITFPNDIQYPGLNVRDFNYSGTFLALQLSFSQYQSQPEVASERGGWFSHYAYRGLLFVTGK